MDESNESKIGSFEEYYIPHTIIAMIVAIALAGGRHYDVANLTVSTGFSGFVYTVIVAVICFGTHTESLSKRLSLLVSLQLTIFTATVFLVVFLGTDVLIQNLKGI